MWQKARPDPMDFNDYGWEFLDLALDVGMGALPFIHPGFLVVSGAYWLADEYYYDTNFAKGILSPARKEEEFE
ncbi:hypothetical protein [Lacimicrobium sp. SS2-24]|uniref:hypothetical protein n=1 Tax=Lacimicrobium sp. SS2-24 TaxID=2005569 RepID=UPI00113210BB|nr:hypothetical protein [Lacimicrobium sp. SS2-24]